MELLYPLLALASGFMMAAIADWIVYAALALTAASTVYSYQATQKAAKDQLKSGGVEITRQDSNAGLTIVYGERALGGVKVWKDVSRSTFAINSGRTVFGQGDATDGVGKTFQLNAWLNRVDVLGQGPMHSITNIEIEDDSYQAPRFRKRNHAIYRGVFMDGNDSQSNLSELATNSDWKASSPGTGVAYMYSRFRAGHYSSDNLDRYFSGEPMMRYHVKGRLVWDPRDVAQSSTNSSTWLWSDNPALCLLDYLTQSYGRNLDYTQIDIDSFKTAADSCDVLVAVPSTNNETGSTISVWDPELGEYVDVPDGSNIPNFRVGQTGLTQKRLTCNAALDPSSTVLENVKILLQSMRGTLPYHNGTYSLKLEDVEPTSMSFTEDDIIGGINFSNGDRSKRFNRTTVVFKNRNKKYKEDRASWPSLDSAEYAALLAEDNDEELFFEVGLDAVTDFYQAEDLAEFITLSSREQLSAGMKVKSKGMLLEPGDVITVTHETPGWSARKFRVRSVKVNVDQTVDLSLTEYNASTYTWRDTSQEPRQEDIGLSSPFDDKLPVTNLAATITRTDTASGVPQGLVDLTFTAPASEAVREYVVRFKPTGTSVWLENLYPPTASEETGAVAVQFLAPQHDTVYDLEVNYFDVGGMLGTSAVSSFTVPEYRTDLDLDLNTIETEVGEILEREIGGEFIPSDLSDLALYYKNSELTLQGNIDTLSLSSQANLDTEVAALEATIASTNTTVTALSGSVTTEVDRLDDRVDSLDTTVTAEIARIDSDVAGVNTLIEDITASTSDVYVQTSAPVAGVSGVPDPIVTNSRWYDSDDSNHPYVWDGSSWVSLRDGQVGVNAAAITALQVDLTTAEGDIVTNAGAISTLDTTLTTLDGVVTANSSDITTLTSGLATTDGTASANSSAISALDVRTTAAEGSITTNSTDITTLQTTTSTQSGDISANTSAISALDVRTTAAEGSITSQASDITQLELDVTAAQGDATANTTALSGLTTRVSTAEGTITTNTSDITALETSVSTAEGNITTNSTAISGLTSRVEFNEGELTSINSDITTLQSDLSTTDGVATANATAIGTLQTGLTATDLLVTANASDITQLELDLATTDGLVTGNTTAISGLDTRITTTEGTLVSQASDITALESSATSLAGDITNNAGAITGLETRVTATETVNTSQATDITTLNADLDFRQDVVAEAGGEILDESGNVIGLENDISVMIAASSQADQLLDARVTSSEQTIESHSADITQLQSDVTNNEAGVSGNATALSALTTTVTQNGVDITANSADITSLQSDLTAAEGSISATSTALSALDTRVTSSEGSISSNASDITALGVTVANNATDTTANGTAISGLDTRVTSAEGSITSNSSSITSLTSSLGNTNSDVTTNATAISGLTTTASELEGDILANAADITSLETTVNHPTSGVAALNTASSALSTRVTATEGSITTNSADITNLTSNLALTDGLVGDNATAITGNSTAISGLTTRVTAAEGTITSQASSLTSLESAVTVLENAPPDAVVFRQAAEPTTGLIEGALWFDTDDNNKLYVYDSGAWVASDDARITGNATAISGLDTRVTSAEGSITSQASDIVSLQSGLSTTNGTVSANATAISGIDTRVTSAEGSISSNTSSITSISSDLTDAESDISTNSSAISGLDTRVTSAEGSITSQATDLTQLQTDLSSTDGTVSANSGAITALDVRVTSAEGSITSQASDITQLQSDLSSTDGSVSVNAGAVSALDTRVTSAEGSITSQAASITALSSDVTDAEGDIVANASAVSGLETRVTTTEGDITNLEAEYYVNLDVDGHVTGVRLYNTGTTSGFTVQADQFSVIAPGATSISAAPFAVDTSGTITMNASVEINGNLVVDGTISQTQMGNNSVGGNQIINGSVSANELEISANTGGTGERMFFNGTDNRIEIFDASNVLRVALGDLTGV